MAEHPGKFAKYGACTLGLCAGIARFQQQLLDCAMIGKGRAPQLAARRGRFRGTALMLEDWESSVQLVVSCEGVIQSWRK